MARSAAPPAAAPAPAPRDAAASPPAAARRPADHLDVVAEARRVRAAEIDQPLVDPEAAVERHRFRVEPERRVAAGDDAPVDPAEHLEALGVRRSRAAGVSSKLASPSSERAAAGAGGEGLDACRVAAQGDRDLAVADVDALRGSCAREAAALDAAGVLRRAEAAADARAGAQLAAQPPARRQPAAPRCRGWRCAARDALDRRRRRRARALRRGARDDRAGGDAERRAGEPAVKLQMPSSRGDAEAQVGEAEALRVVLVGHAEVAACPFDDGIDDDVGALCTRCARPARGRRPSRSRAGGRAAAARPASARSSPARRAGAGRRPSAPCQARRLQRSGRAQRFGDAGLEARARRPAGPEPLPRKSRACSQVRRRAPRLCATSSCSCRASRRRARRRRRPGRPRHRLSRRCGAERRRCGRQRGGVRRGCCRRPTMPARDRDRRARRRGAAIASTHSGGKRPTRPAARPMRPCRAAELAAHALDRPPGEVDAVERERAAGRRIGGAADAPAAFAATQGEAAEAQRRRLQLAFAAQVGPAPFDPSARDQRAGEQARRAPVGGRPAGRRAAAEPRLSGACTSGASRSSCGASSRSCQASSAGFGAKRPSANAIAGGDEVELGPRVAVAVGIARLALQRHAGELAFGERQRRLAAGRGEQLEGRRVGRRRAGRARTRPSRSGDWCRASAGSRLRPATRAPDRSRASVARPEACQGAFAAARCSRPASVARAPPRLASAWRTTISLAARRASRRSRADCGAFCGRRRSASWPARSARSSTRAASSVAAAKPVPTAASLPSSTVSGARASSAAGRSLSSVRSSCQRSALQRPAPAIRPPARRPAPSSAEKVCTSTVPGSSGRARNSARRLSTGSRPSFQRPARALRRSSAISAGRSRPLLVAVARPLRLVAGASSAKAERSSDCVAACSSPSGQAANGRSTAFASSDCAPCGGAAATRAVAPTAARRAGRSRVALACQAGALAADAAARRASIANGGSALIVASPDAAARSWLACSAAKRCSAPLSSPRWMRPRRARRAKASSPAPRRSSSTLAARMSISIGRRSVSGGVGGAPGGAAASPGSSVMRSACRLAIVRRSHLPALPRLACSVCQLGGSRRSVPLPGQA